jgi:hypothetical protein
VYGKSKAAMPSAMARLAPSSEPTASLLLMPDPGVEDGPR